SEKPPARLSATSDRPTSPRTSSTRVTGRLLEAAIHLRWLRAERLGCTHLASSSDPTTLSGFCSCPYGTPLTVAVPAVGRSSPRIIRIVVDLPAPLGPRKPVTMPGLTVKVKSSTATVEP